VIAMGFAVLSPSYKELIAQERLIAAWPAAQQPGFGSASMSSSLARIA
jgi:hypothetical protein